MLALHVMLVIIAIFLIAILVLFLLFAGVVELLCESTWIAIAPGYWQFRIRRLIWDMWERCECYHRYCKSSVPVFAKLLWPRNNALFDRVNAVANLQDCDFPVYVHRGQDAQVPATLRVSGQTLSLVIRRPNSSSSVYTTLGGAIIKGWFRHLTYRPEAPLPPPSVLTN
jgi:hypothetical protein